MNFRLVFRLLCLVLLVISAAIAVVGLWAALRAAQGEAPQADAARALLAAAAVGVVLGGIPAWLFRRERQHLLRREAMLLVVGSWVLGAALAALPYWLWNLLVGPAAADHPFAQPINCYFEAMSGLTTTGSSILNEIESLPRGLLLWRSLTHWLGGLGIVVLFVAVLSSLGISAKKLFTLESSVVDRAGMHPRIKDTARVLWLVYLGLTGVEIAALRLAGLSWFEALCETFGSLATGGFSVRNASIAAYRSPLAETIIIAFMVLGGVNFVLYYQLIRGRWKRVWRDRELRLFLALLLIGGLIVSAYILAMPVRSLDGQTHDPGPTTALRYGFFNAVSMQTDTGFATSDFTAWPQFSRTLILFVALIGGCTGSTTGGIKVFRLFTAAQILLRRMTAFFQPKRLAPVRYNHRPIDKDDQTAIVLMVLMFLLSLAAGALGILLLEPQDCSIRTGLSAALATLCTAGPGLGEVGPAGNFGFFTAHSKAVMCGLMLIGRLEVIPVLAVCSPRFWRPV